jgi:N-acyl-L-amino-acid amidohydrolase
MDVVPIEDEALWIHKPFGADIDAEGRIFARGSQDTKCIGTQYLAALRYFIQNKIQFKRTIHVTFTPDEEIGSNGGMKNFVLSDDFKNLNVEFVLDEGGPQIGDNFVLFHGERSSWRAEFIVTGVPGHGSLLMPNTAAVKLQKLLTKITNYRQSQADKLEDPTDLLTLGHVTSVNVNTIHGGVQDNVIASEFKVMVDMRVAPNVDHDELIKLMQTWCDESGDGISLKFKRKESKVPPTPVDDSNKFWTAFKKATDEL